MAESGSKSTPKKAAGSRSSSPRKSAPAKAAEKAQAAEQEAREAQATPATPGVQENPAPSAEGTSDVNEGVQQASDTAQVQAPEDDAPERQGGGMSEDDVVKQTGNKEAGLSPAAYQAGNEPAPTAATEVNRERNGRPLEIGTTTEGPTREAQENTPIAATGYGDRNGAPVEVHEQGQTSTEFGGNSDPTAQLLAEGVRAEVGTGTGVEAPPDERPQYPTRALNRRSERGKPFQPKDSEHQADPQHGDMMTSTDATAANATIQTHAGDNFVALRGEDGNEVKPSEFFEVPENGSNAVRVVNQRITEEYTVHRTTTTSQRLLFPKGAEVPVQQAEQLIHLHG
jgi:hypothetical protein